MIAIENTRLLNELRQRTTDLTESLEQQTATSEVLKVISSSPGELKPVFNAMLANAVRICEAKFGVLFQHDGHGAFQALAWIGASPEYAALLQQRAASAPPTGTPLHRLLQTKNVVHTVDDSAGLVPGAAARLSGARSLIAVPMFKEDELVGAVIIYRQEVRSFTDKQIALVQNFAAQAVIAIENTRLLNELRQRTTDLSKSLQQQTATAEVLQVISGSPGDLDPVFASMLEKAVLICDATFGNIYRWDGETGHVIATHDNTPAAFAEERKRSPDWRPGPNTPVGRMLVTKSAVHVANLATEDAYTERLDPVMVAAVELGGVGTVLFVPMLKESELIGFFGVARQGVRLFTDKQIDLVKNFAAQAVIAIENTRLLNELRQRTADLTESLEQQTATSEVLGVISRSPGELDPVFAAILANATRLCEANFGLLQIQENDAFHVAAMHNPPPAFASHRQNAPLIRPGPFSALGRVAATKQLVHIADYAEDAAYKHRDPIAVSLVELAGARTLVLVPMLKDGELIGNIAVYRQEVRPFTDKQIALVQNFAAQAVIAIENTRLLNELRQRTDDLSESLEQQTATADVLKVISSSPADLEPVFRAMLENATRICDAKFGNIYRWDGESLHLLAAHNTPPAFAEFRKKTPFRPSPNIPTGRMVTTKTLTHVADLAAEPGYAERDPQFVAGIELGGIRTLLSVPMLKEDELVGAFTLYRDEVRPFSDKQIALVQSFAAQAVIAIENTRLLNELRQSLAQQTATSDVLSVISSSPGELEPVFQSVLENATRICEANFGDMFLVEADIFRTVAMHNAPVAYLNARSAAPFRPPPGSGLGQLIATKNVVHIADLKAEPHYLQRQRFAIEGVELGGIRTLLAVPMFKDDALVGAIVIYRHEVRPFTEKQIALVQNFAAQAVIAIENTRLLNELRQRTDDLSEALDQQTATSEVLKVIAGTQGELQPVFETMLAKATELCGASYGALWLRVDDGFRYAALHGDLPQIWTDHLRNGTVIRVRPDVPLARLMQTLRPVSIPDMRSDPSYLNGDPLPVSGVDIGGIRTLVLVPMIMNNDLVGTIAIYRKEVRPFAEKQIELLSNFAAQAVIAIENTRLLKELRQSLEQQTATADVLRVISSSPGELEPVFHSMLENAARVCDAKFGMLFRLEDDAIRPVASLGVPEQLMEYFKTGSRQPSEDAPIMRVARTKQPVHVTDFATEPAYLSRNPLAVASVEHFGVRTLLVVPILKDNEFIGAFAIFRQEVRPFNEKQIDLVKNFAAQAVIAIENARLLSELRKSLEQQTATSEVLRVISSSPGELEPVFQAMLENAVRICEAKFGVMFRFDADVPYPVATLNLSPAVDDYFRRRGRLKPTPGSDLDRLWNSKQVIHTLDMSEIAKSHPHCQACWGAHANRCADAQG